MQIIGFSIENFKRVQAFSCHIDKASGLITIGGENANGKSSVLDAIQAALCGPSKAITNPVHEGAEEATIKLMIGTGSEVTYRIVRKFSKNAPPSIKVYNANGGLEANGSAVLKDLLGASGVDPVAFLNLEPIKQRNLLAELVGLNLDTYDQEIATAREKVKEAESHQNRLEARVTELPWFDDAPEETVDAAALSAKLSGATIHNSKATMLKTECDHLENRIGAMAVDIERQAAEIKRLTEDLEAKTAKLQDVQQQHVSKSLELAGFERIDTEAITAELSQIEQTNEKVRANQAKVRARAEWNAAEDHVKVQKEAEARAVKAKKDALAAAKFPIDGLSFEGQQIMYNGQPLSQASQAERLRVAMAIALAMRGQVAPIILRDASVLDRASIAEVEALANKHGAIVFAEIVANQDDSGFDRDCDFYIVDGNEWNGGQ